MRTPDLLSPPKELRWLYIDFNSYFASVEQQVQKSLRGKPVAVVPVETDSTCAIAASYEAKAFDVKTGTPIYEAKKRCPGLICVLARHDLYVSYHHKILQEIDRYTLVHKVCSIDEMACRLMINERSEEAIRDLAIRLKSGLAKNVGEYVRCSIGAAPNAFLAKIAGNMKKPDGLTLLFPDQLRERLENICLSDVPGIGYHMERRLNHVHIWTMKRLLQLAPKEMRAVWKNVWGERLWYLLRGYEIPDLETKKRSLGHSQVLSPALRDPKESYDVARRLTAKAASRLRRTGYYAAGISLTVLLEQNNHALKRGYCCEKRFPHIQDSPSFLGYLDDLWGQIRIKTGAQRFKKVGITLFSLEREKNIQGDLFKDHLSVKEQQRLHLYEKLSDSVDYLNQRFGRDTVIFGCSSSSQEALFTGTKIAFNRIPDLKEFQE